MKSATYAKWPSERLATYLNISILPCERCLKGFCNLSTKST